MILKALGKLAMLVVLAGSLAGCIDAKVEVELLSARTAKAVTTQIMGADFYTMIKMNEEEIGEDQPEEDRFCARGELSENSDGTASCVIREEGRFAQLRMGAKRRHLRFTPEGGDLVRVALPISGMKSEIGADEAMDAETQKMVEAFFAGRGLSIRFSGLEVVETNMKLSGNGRSAEQKIMFLDLLRDKEDLPQEYYAVVRVP
ncbi:hypothetical protein [Devosia submarina]|uniref:hypothetical protein n=1 Tax=Devosia submarina TaxID=1173082 RepID=UPI000D3D7754|nr:hypothetical protein [Devosia submarina]